LAALRNRCDRRAGRGGARRAARRRSRRAARRGGRRRRAPLPTGRAPGGRAARRRTSLAALSRPALVNRIPDGVPRSAWLAAPEAGAGAGWRFAAPRGALAAADPAEVPALLAEVERATARGLWAVGYVAYEAAPGFD